MTVALSDAPAPQIAKIPGGQVSYLEAGEGTPLVLLHGIGSAAVSWRHQIAAFAPRFRVIAWNAPGYGASTTPAKEAPEAIDYARALAALLDALSVKQCHLVGHSLGTLMAASFAASFGARVLSLSLCGASNGYKSAPERGATMLQDRLNDLATLGTQGMARKRGPRLLGPNATPEMIREVVEIQAVAITPEGYPRAARMLASADIYVDIARFRADLPIQVIYGEDDAISPPEQCRKIAAAAKAPAHPVPRAGHALYLENPERVNTLIDAFISRSS